MKNVLYAINTSPDPYYVAAASLMTPIMTVSRLTYKPDFIKMKSVCPLPVLPGAFTKNFSDISLARAAELWNQCAKNANVNVFWSGGIDSTVALVALLMTRPQNHTVSVYCNLNSIIECPGLYEKLLVWDYVKLKSSSIIPSDKPIAFITGELGDQIFGSDLLFRIARQGGFQNLFSSYQDVVPKLFVDRCGEVYGKKIFARYEPIVKEAPFQIKTAFDFIWWWNFTQKWQCVKYRNLSLIEEMHSLVHFFEDQDFQIWSVFNHTKKITTSLESYKMPAKEFIYSFAQDESYMKYKKKYGSPFGNRRYFYILFDDGSKVDNWNECSRVLNELNLVID